MLDQFKLWYLYSYTYRNVVANLYVLYVHKTCRYSHCWHFNKYWYYIMFRVGNCAKFTTCGCFPCTFNQYLIGHAWYTLGSYNCLFCTQTRDDKTCVFSYFELWCRVFILWAIFFTFFIAFFVTKTTFLYTKVVLKQCSRFYKSSNAWICRVILNGIIESATSCYCCLAFNSC